VLQDLMRMNNVVPTRRGDRVVEILNFKRQGGHTTLRGYLSSFLNHSGREINTDGSSWRDASREIGR
jgi:hypothetical protein